MKKWKLLPTMAVKGIIANKTVYYPYIFAGIFAAFTYFVFSSILHNDLMAILPYKAYALVMLYIGKVLLGIILLCFLIYAGSFVSKRRKKEIGLYNLLGLEKKHISVMIMIESIILYGIVMMGGLLMGVVLSKLFFLLLLKMSNIPINVKFVFTWEAFLETLSYFGVVFFINFIGRLWDVGKSRPTELLAGSRKGEKEPRLLLIWSVVGVVILGLGYSASISSKADSMIFINFFLAVFLVIVGTYLVFTSGSVLFLKCFRRNKRLYYRPSNFITVSGMYYRMKKNAAGLVNICIFSTMILITLVCTVFVCLGLEDVARYTYPYDIAADFEEGSLMAEQMEDKLEELEAKYTLSVERADLFNYISLACSKEGNQFGLAETNPSHFEDYRVIILTLDVYSDITGDKEELSKGEVLVYADGKGFGYDALEFMGIKSNIRKEVQGLYPYPKAEQNTHGRNYVVIVRDDAARDEYVRAWGELNGVEDMEGFLRSGSQKLGVFLSGSEGEKAGFVEDFALWCREQPGFRTDKNGLEGRGDLRSMHGGLLFIGMIFGLLFLMCLIIIMYYKQISEGYEDRESFSIMKKVGMSEDEIKSTIHRQILLVFGLPLAGALIHTFVGMFMVERLMAVIDFYDIRLMIGCLVGVSAVFLLVYGSSYIATAKTYYRIVNHKL